jgi:hypothetical protein
MATSVGGFALFAGGSYSNIVDIYNINTGKWSNATLSQTRTLGGAATVGKYAVFAGGLSPDFDVWDSETQSWSVVVSPNSNQWEQSMTAVGPYVVIAGGNGPSNSVVILDTRTMTLVNGTVSEIESFCQLVI